MGTETSSCVNNISTASSSIFSTPKSISIKKSQCTITSTSMISKVKVIVRVRPFLVHEIKGYCPLLPCASLFDSTQEQEVTVILKDPDTRYLKISILFLFLLICFSVCVCVCVIFLNVVVEMSVSSWTLFTIKKTTMWPLFSTKKLAIWFLVYFLAVIPLSLLMGLLVVEKLTLCRYTVSSFVDLRFYGRLILSFAINFYIIQCR